MARKYGTGARKVSLDAAGNIKDKPVGNLILRDLPRREGRILFPKLEFVALPTQTVLIGAGETIKFAYFLNLGLASILSSTGDGKSVEVGLCGKEGFVGTPLTAGLKTSHTLVFMQVSGSGFRVASADLIDSLRHCPSLGIALRFTGQEQNLQSSQVAACNRIHDVEERLARWLLMSQDRLGSEIVPLTQQFLAYMLGSRRASVTVAAGVLQRAGLITYARGTVKIQDRARLMDAACKCYAMMTKQAEMWRKELGRP